MRMKTAAKTDRNGIKPVYRTALIMLLISGRQVVGAPAAPPDLIVILTEDQGYHDVGFNGCKDVPTPNLDSIASNGVRFTSGYVSSPLSSPSRAGLLTGRYQERFGYERDPEWPINSPELGLPLTETTLAEVLGKAGYETGMVGKWHLGVNPPMDPLKRGFAEFFGFLGATHSYLPDDLAISNSGMSKIEVDSRQLRISRNNQPVKATKYLTDEFSEEAVQFIARHKEKPFFLVLSYNAPHAPMEATEKYLNRFPKIAGLNRRTYAAMVSAVDDGVGSVLAELRKDALVEQTLVVYLSVTGGPLDANSSDNYPLRGYKNSPWEGSCRVPFAMQWPGHLPKGMSYDQPVLSLDIFATFASLANAPLDPGTPLDGVNLVPYLTGQKTGAPHDAIFFRIPAVGGYAVRSGDYKMIVPTANQAAELYDVTRDISELKNMAGAKPGMVTDLQKKYAAWNRQMASLSTSGTNEGNIPKAIDTEQPPQ
jgi:arylsulfatase A-like enzyme